MRFAEIESNVNIVSLFDLDSQDMDRNHDQINNTQQQYSSDNIKKTYDFVNEISTDAIDDLEKDDSVNYENLNKKQKTIFNRIKSHYSNILMG